MVRRILEVFGEKEEINGSVVDRERQNFDEHGEKEISVAEQFWLDACLFPLRLVIIVKSLLQNRFVREKERLE